VPLGEAEICLGWGLVDGRAEVNLAGRRCCVVELMKRKLLSELIYAQTKVAPAAIIGVQDSCIESCHREQNGCCDRMSCGTTRRRDPQRGGHVAHTCC
jgi:hypothetical protein